MKELIPIDLKEIVENVKAEGKGRRVLWQDSESIAFLSSGRKERRDFHIDPADEVTLQLSGVQNLVYRTPDGREQTAVHQSRPNAALPRRRAAFAAARRRFLVHCLRAQAPDPEKSITSNGFATSAARKIYETTAEVGDYRADPVGQVYQKFSSDEKLRTCKNCGTVVPVPPG